MNVNIETKYGVMKFDEPQFSITPGQAAVWYDDDRLLGGGVIQSA